MKKLEKLNKKQIALMSIKRDEWVNLALHAGPHIDEEECESGIKWMYYASNLKEPKVVFAKGPEDFSKKITKIIRANISDSVRDSVKTNIRDSVRASVGASVGASVWDSVWDSVRASVGASVRASVWDSVGASVGASVRASVWDSVRASVGASVRASVWDSVYLASTWTCLSGDADFGAWYEYWKKINIVSDEKADKYIGYLRTGAFYVLFFEKYAFVIERPIAVYQDEQKRLHSLEHPSIEWRDGTKLYHINGVSLDKKLWEKIVNDKLTPKQVFALENTEQRRIAYEYMDKLKMKKLKNYKILDHRNKDEQGKMDEVVQFNVKGFDDPFLYYHCECPTTGRRYFLQTKETTCKKAKDISFGLDNIQWTNEW